MDLVGAGVDQLHVIPGITRPPWKRTCGKLNQRLRIASASSALNATMKPSMTSRACLTAVSIASEVIQIIVPLIAGKFEALFNHLVSTPKDRRCPHVHVGSEADMAYHRKRILQRE